MTQRSPYQQLREIGFLINRLGIAADMDTQTTAAKKAFAVLKRDIQRAQDLLKEYEMLELEEDARKQAALLPKALKALQAVRESLLHASEYELIGAVDVAQLSSQVDGLVDKLA